MFYAIEKIEYYFIPIPVKQQKPRITCHFRSLTTFGFLERASITTDELFSHFDGNNQYAYVAGRKEYYDYVKDLFYQRNHILKLHFPIV